MLVLTGEVVKRGSSRQGLRIPRDRQDDGRGLFLRRSRQASVVTEKGVGPGSDRESKVGLSEIDVRAGRRSCSYQPKSNAFESRRSTGMVSKSAQIYEAVAEAEVTVVKSL